MSWEGVMEKVFFWAIGALSSGLVAYIMLGRQVEFVKGQLSQLLDIWRSHQALRESHITLAEDYHLHKHLSADQAHPPEAVPPASLHG